MLFMTSASVAREQGYFEGYDDMIANAFLKTLREHKKSSFA